MMGSSAAAKMAGSPVVAFNFLDDRRDLERLMAAFRRTGRRRKIEKFHTFGQALDLPFCRAGLRDLAGVEDRSQIAVSPMFEPAMRHPAHAKIVERFGTAFLDRWQSHVHAGSFTMSA